MTHQGHVTSSNGHATFNGSTGPHVHDLPGLQPSPHPAQNPYGANPPSGWSQHVGPPHKAPPSVATQLVVPGDLNDTPVTLTCYNCQDQVTTSTKTGPSMLSWLSCLCLCLFCCWPCGLIPLCCCPRLNVTEHYCPQCGIQLGKYKAWKQ